MRTAEEILHSCRDVKGFIKKVEIIEAINEARKEAIEECAKRATVSIEPHWSGEQEDDCYVDTESILSLIKELK